MLSASRIGNSPHAVLRCKKFVGFGFGSGCGRFRPRGVGLAKVGSRRFIWPVMRGDYTSPESVEAAGALRDTCPQSLEPIRFEENVNAKERPQGRWRLGSL